MTITMFIINLILAQTSTNANDFPWIDTHNTNGNCTKVGTADRCGIDCGSHWASCVKGDIGYSCRVFKINESGDSEYVGDHHTHAPVCGH